MGEVHDDNALRKLEAAKRQARLSQSAHHYFKETPGGKELYKELEFQCGVNCPAFSAKDNFNPHGAAFRDGMREGIQIISRLVKAHEENKKHDE